MSTTTNGTFLGTQYTYGSSALGVTVPGAPPPGLGTVGPGLGPKASSRAKMQKLVQLVAFQNGAPWLTFTFLINPEKYQQIEQARAQVVQTLGGGYADLFGPALVQIQFSGTTGLQQMFVNGFHTDGYERFVGVNGNDGLLPFIRKMWSDPIAHQGIDYQFFLYNWTDDQFYEVLPLANTWVQAVPQQLVFYYQLSMVALRDATKPRSIPPYAIRQWFLGSEVESALATAASASVNAAMAYLLTQNSADLSGVPGFIQSQVLTQQVADQQEQQAVLQSLPIPSGLLQQGSQPSGAGYIPYLQPQDFPAEEFYPGVSSINSAVASILQPGLFATLQTVATGGVAPLAVSYGQLSATTTSLLQQLQSLENLSAVPSLLDAELGDLCDRLQTLLLFPAVFQA